MIYSDVYQYYFDNGRDDKPQELEFVIERSINNTPAYRSIERVLTQVFTEAHRCFYKQAKVDVTSQHIMHGVLRSLRAGESYEVLARWQRPDFLQLRRDVSWLTLVDRVPDCMDRPSYIDPVDFMRWVCERGIGFQPVGLNLVGTSSQAGSQCHLIPEMLVGPAHGDLHGRNIILLASDTRRKSGAATGRDARTDLFARATPR